MNVLIITNRAKFLNYIKKQEEMNRFPNGSFNSVLYDMDSNNSHPSGKYYSSTVFTSEGASTTITNKLFTRYFIDENVLHSSKMEWFNSLHYILKYILRSSDPFDPNLIDKLMTPLVTLTPCSLCRGHIRKNVTYLLTTRSFQNNGQFIKALHDEINLSKKRQIYSNEQFLLDESSGVYNKKEWANLHLQNFLKVCKLAQTYEDSTLKQEHYERVLLPYIDLLSSLIN